MIKPGTRVLIRTYSAGVHFGTLIERNGQEVHLKEARRLWSWQGALSLSEIAAKGCALMGSSGNWRDYSPLTGRGIRK